MGLFVRTIGICQAEAKVTLANLAYNMDHPGFHERRAAMGRKTGKLPKGGPETARSDGEVAALPRRHRNVPR
jgi:hypothetical protein